MLGQSDFTVEEQPHIVRSASVNMADHEYPDVFLEYVEYPKPGGKYYQQHLTEQKRKSAELFPNGSSPSIGNRVAIDTPVLLEDFAGNSWISGIPLDNHLAVSNSGYVVTVVNTQLVVLDETGSYLGVFNLDEFWGELGEIDLYFDPRIIYDPAEDRFIMAMMQDFDCAGSNIVFAFSNSPDPTGEWNLYQFEGCPKSNATFADFPMISITSEELFFTYNAVYQDSTWQTGFAETFIYQIDKTHGYAGDSLDWRSWSNINLDGRTMRYICPIKYATAEMNPEAYFVSNRSFDIQNDTIWLIHIESTLDDPAPTLDIRYLIAEIPYGVPPNATQPKDRLQTNDARILDGFYVDDHIQFVSSTVDPGTGLSAVYHGIIEAPSGLPILTSVILNDPTAFRAYPGIAYCGLTSGDRDAIIVAIHASDDRFPGISALYTTFGEYSEWMTVKEGLRNIDMFKVNNPFGVDPTLERWGDYVGIQPQYNSPGTVWTAACYGKPGSTHDTWVGYLSRPLVETSTKDPNDTPEVSIFPNPAQSHVTIDLTLKSSGGTLTASLFDVSGQFIQTIHTEEVTREAPLRFHYNTTGLSTGSYVLTLAMDNVPVASKTIIVQ